MTETHYICYLDPGECDKGQWVLFPTLLRHLKQLGYEQRVTPADQVWHRSSWSAEIASPPGQPMPHQWYVLRAACMPARPKGVGIDPSVQARFNESMLRWAVEYQHARFAWRADRQEWELTMPKDWVTQLVAGGHLDV